MLVRQYIGGKKTINTGQHYDISAHYS